MNRERKIETKEVDAVTPPPRARVTETPAETFDRKKDYLAGFLAGDKAEEPSGGAGSGLNSALRFLRWLRASVLKSVTSNAALSSIS